MALLDGLFVLCKPGAQLAEGEAEAVSGCVVSGAEDLLDELGLAWVVSRRKEFLALVVAMEPCIDIEIGVCASDLGKEEENQHREKRALH